MNIIFDIHQLQWKWSYKELLSRIFCYLPWGSLTKSHLVIFLCFKFEWILAQQRLSFGPILTIRCKYFEIINLLLSYIASSIKIDSVFTVLANGLNSCIRKSLWATFKTISRSHINFHTYHGNFVVPVVNLTFIAFYRCADNFVSFAIKYRYSFIWMILIIPTKVTSLHISSSKIFFQRPTFNFVIQWSNNLLFFVVKLMGKKHANLPDFTSSFRVLNIDHILTRSSVIDEAKCVNTDTWHNDKVIIISLSFFCSPSNKLFT